MQEAKTTQYPDMRRYEGNSSNISRLFPRNTLSRTGNRYVLNLRNKNIPVFISKIRC